MTEPTRFAADVQAWADKAGKGYEQMARAVLLQATAQIIERTPVKSGRARGNWQATTGSPATGVTDAEDKDGSTTQAAAGETIQDAIGSEFYLTNNLPYIRRLEFEGWSQQAPAGMVRITLQNVEQGIKRAIAELP